MTTKRPQTIDEAAQLAHDTVLAAHPGDTELADIVRRGVLDAYRIGANQALEAAARELDMYAQHSAAHRVRARKLTGEA